MGFLRVFHSTSNFISSGAVQLLLIITPYLL